MATYAYYRVSTQSQVEANGTEMQQYVVENYCKENNIELDHIFQDEGISGNMDDLDDDLKRDGMLSMLAELNNGDLVIVQNTARLWRSDTAKVMIRREIKRAGANLYSIEQPTYDIYKKEPNDFLVNSIMEILDEYDRMTIALKLAKGRKARANNGYKPCGNAPYGYRWIGNEIEIDYNNNLIVKDIFEKYAELKSLEKLKNYCISCGYKTATGKDFSKQALKNIIENDFYVGIVTYAGKKMSGEHKPIVNRKLFDLANEILKR